YGIEIVPQAVEDAKKNALINNVENVEFFCGDVAKTAQQLNETDSPDVVILDPPRKGCDNDMLSLLLELAPQRIAYISCNPATLARDMAYLCENGYTPGAVQPVDMFPQTSHVETLVLMSKM
ncbi:MAG: 23S rRNA (uracil-5-)-methyltransferase RumA, partial [Bacillota bacterium]|nr:23S rRNA (uracil-5-)-methyltransferase RumA [Bacillota bacterium]